MLTRQRLALLAGVFLAVGPAGHAAPAAKVDYARDIRPILAQHCASCHGFDEKARKAGLRLDLPAEAIAAKAIVPGDADASPPLPRIESPDKSEQMPPPGAKKPLGAEQKRLLRLWVQQGATHAGHWA